MKFRLTFLTASSACSTLLLAAPALAERYVSASGDDIAPVGVPIINSCLNISTPCKTLQLAVWQAQPDERILVFGAIQAHDIVITKPLTITGSSGSVIDAARRGRHFRVTPTGSLTLEDLLLIGGKTTGGGNGGAISAQGELTLTNCTLVDNEADGSGGAIYFAPYDEQRLELDTVVIRGNTAFGNGGGIDAHGDITLEATEIRNNQSFQDGGGIAIAKASASIVDSVVVSNTAEVHGGGLYAYASDVTLDASSVEHNDALAGDGGGIFYAPGLILGTVNPVSLLVQRSPLSRNTAAGDGGAIYAESAPVTVNVSTLDHNHANRGAGIFSNGATLEVEQSSLRGNIAGSEGGGIYASGGHNAVVNSTLSYNQATHYGGAFCNRSRDMLLLHVTAVNNGAADGPALYSSDAATITNSIFETRGLSAPSCGGVANVGAINLIGAHSSAFDSSCGGSLLPDGFNLGRVVGLATTSTIDPDTGTEYFALEPFNNAKDKGVTCDEPTDQRGLPRSLPCDLGAIEFIP